MPRAGKPPLLLRVPLGLREQPAWVFIGILIFLVGLSYLTGFTNSIITEAIGDIGLKVWGGLLALSGLLVTWATIVAKPVMEKFSLRIMTCTLLMYAGYLATVVPVRDAAMTTVLTILLSGLSEFRVAHLRFLLIHATQLNEQLGALEND